MSSRSSRSGCALSSRKMACGPWPCGSRRGHTARSRPDSSDDHGEKALPAGQEIVREGQGQGRHEGNGLRLRQAGLEAGDKRCPEREESYGQTGGAPCKDSPLRENAGGEANGAYGVFPVSSGLGLRQAGPLRVRQKLLCRHHATRRRASRPPFRREPLRLGLIACQLSDTVPRVKFPSS